MKFYEVECPERIEIVVANSNYEAYGFVALSDNVGTDFTGDIFIRGELPQDHKVEVSCVGFPVYKTLKEMYDELDNKELPVSICELDW